MMSTGEAEVECDAPVAGKLGRYALSETAGVVRNSTLRASGSVSNSFIEENLDLDSDSNGRVTRIYRPVLLIRRTTKSENTPCQSDAT